MTLSIIDTPEQVMDYALEGRLTKRALANLLAPESRRGFLDACATIEKSYTCACAAARPCLESGCSCEGEICLQPLQRAETEYHSACGAVWAKLFANRQHRDAAWRHTFSECEHA